MLERLRNFRKRQQESKAQENVDIAHLSGADVLRKFVNASLPDAVESLLFRVSIASPGDPDVSGFERYSARVLRHAGADRLRGIAVKGPLKTLRLPKTNLFWIRYEKDCLEPEECETVLLVEAALNRLVAVEKSLSTLVKNDAGIVPDEALCCVLDWAMLRSVADDSGTYVKSETQPNPYADLYGTKAVPGGKWDVLTAVIKECEDIPLPMRLIYTVDVFGEPGTVCIRFAMPSPEAFPHDLWLEQEHRWIDAASMLPGAAAAYTVRAALRLAALCFGASAGVMRVVVNAYGGSFRYENLSSEPYDQALLSLEFDRLRFLNITLPALAEKKLSEIQTECDCQSLLKIASPSACRIQVGEDGGMQPITPLAFDSAPCRAPLPEDERPLPPVLRDLFHADKVRDLDVMSEKDPQAMARMRRIIAEADDSPLLAIAQLEDLACAAEKEDAAALAAASAGSIPLYCQGPTARYFVSLVSDSPKDRYVRVSDIGYLSREALADLYLKIGDEDAALAQAQRCLELAPSSTGAYTGLASVYAARNQFDKAIEPLVIALHLEGTRGNASYIYYRLAFALWQTGRLEEGLACYLRVHPGNQQVYRKAQSELAELLEEMEMTSTEGFDADAVLRAGGIPLAPTNEIRDLLAKESILLCDASVPIPAAHVVKVLGHILNSDVLRMAAVSLANGA